MARQQYQVRYRSESFGTIALHSNHSTREGALEASHEFARHVKRTPMDPKSKHMLLDSIRVAVDTE